MTLTQLATEFAAATGSTGLGFIIKSTESGNKFTVDYKFASGKFAITRLDNGKNFVVDGSLERYELASTIGSIREMVAEVAELKEQKTVIEGRLATLTSELGSVGFVG